MDRLRTPPQHLPVSSLAFGDLSFDDFRRHQEDQLHRAIWRDSTCVGQVQCRAPDSVCGNSR